MIIIDDTNDQVPKLLYRNAGPCLDNDRPHVRETTLGTHSISPDSQRLASIAQTLLGQATLRGVVQLATSPDARPSQVFSPW